MCERELETEQNCNILAPTLLVIIAFLFRSPGLLNWGPGGPASLGHVPHSSIFSPTDWTSCAPSCIIVRRPPPSCGYYKSHSFNPSTVKVIFWYSSTRCTWHRCISYFDSPAGSEVNIQHIGLLTLCNFSHAGQIGLWPSFGIGSPGLKVASGVLYAETEP